ncbi:MAG: DUF4038 domain-containing protein [Clostridia bacterium]|jgi:hypothetical protein
MLKRTVAVLCAISLIFSQGIFSGIVAAKDKTAPIMKVASPKNNQINVATNSKISLKFSENIYKSKYFSKIKLTKSNKATTITATISKNYLKVAHKYSLSYSSSYVLSVPAYSVKDKSGNILKKAITIKFKTKAKITPTPTKTPTRTPTKTPSPTPTQIIGTTVNNDAELTSALNNSSIGTIIFNASAAFGGFTVKYPVYIVGNGAAVSSGITVNSDNVTFDNLNVTAANTATGSGYNFVYQISSGKTDITIKNGSARGTLNKARTKGVVCPSSTTSAVTVADVSFIDSKYGILPGNDETGGIITVTDCSFTNVDYGIGWTDGTTIADIKGNVFNAGLEGIGLGLGLNVTIPGQSVYSLVNYLKANNTFNGYVEFKDIADYRNLPATPTPSSSPTTTPMLGPVYTPSPLPSSTPENAFPLKVSANSRYLADQNNNPFYVFADTAHGMFNYATHDDVDAYLQARAQQGVNTLLCYGGGYFLFDRKNWQGEYEFISGDLSQPNDAYFENIDWCINKAAEYGIQVILDPLPMDPHRSRYTLENSYSLGRYIGTRYKDFKNIMWCVGGDMDPNTAEIEMINEMARGISETDPNHLISFYPSGGKSSSAIFASKTWLSYNMIQVHEGDETDAPKNYQLMLSDYNKNPAKPSIMIEPNYESSYSELRVRRALTWSMLSGSFGITYGNNIVRNFAAVNGGPGSYVYGVSLKDYWYPHLTDPAFLSTMNLVALLSSHSWNNFKPDQSHTVVISGYGNVPLEHESTILANDGSASITYLPTARAITINMAKFSGSKTLKWFDMTNNTFRNIVGTFPNTGTVDLPARPSNNAGGNDWILVIE